MAQMVEICLQCKRLRFNPCIGNIPWRREWQPTPVFLPGKSHGQRTWQATVPGVAKSQTQLSDKHFYFQSKQYSSGIKKDTQIDGTDESLEINPCTYD